MKQTKNPFKLMKLLKDAFAPLVTVWWTDLQAALTAKRYDLVVLAGVRSVPCSVAHI
jgi:hypothetical protein